MSIQLAPNLVIADRFRLNHEIGRGGMGSVWHATHLGLDMPCAVKFIEGEMSQVVEAQSRFEREAKAAAQLRSPHVVQILDHGVWRGTPYIAMELLDGEDLGMRLRRLSRLTPQEVLQIILPICRALTKAHMLGIVHRDLKPDNVFIVRDDDREIPKVLDFGIAKAIGISFNASATRTGALLGTPYYMSPEQAQGIRAVDARSDLWSLAVIVFQMLTGALPFESEALGDLLVKIIVAPIPKPSHVTNDLPPAFDQWWAKASQREPSQRYQTAREFGETLVSAIGQSSGPRVAASGPYPPVVEGQLAPAASRRSPNVGSGLGTMPATGAPTAHTTAPISALPTTTPVAKSFGWVAKGGAALALLTLAVLALSFALRTKPSDPVESGAPTTTGTGAAAGPTRNVEPAPVVPMVMVAPSPSEAQSTRPVGMATPSSTAALAPPERSLPRPRAAGTGKGAPVPAAKPGTVPASTPVPAGKRKTVDLGI